MLRKLGFDNQQLLYLKINIQHINIYTRKITFKSFGCLQIFDRLLIKIKAIFTYAGNIYDVYKEIQIKY